MRLVPQAVQVQRRQRALGAQSRQLVGAEVATAAAVLGDALLNCQLLKAVGEVRECGSAC